MGLLDDVLGAAMRGGNDQGQTQGGSAGGGLGGLLGGLMGGGQQQGSGPQQDGGMPGQTQDSGGLGGMLGGLFGGAGGAGQGMSGGGGGGGLAGMLGSLLGNNGQAGGLGGLMHKFDQAGMGDKARSWVGNGQNEDVSGDQVNQALGQDTMSNLASRFGINASMLAPLLASVLPALIDRLTPHGQVPEDGLGDEQEVQRRLSDSL